METSKQITDLAQLAELAWKEKSQKFSVLKDLDRGLERRIKDLSLPPNKPDISQQILGFDRISKKWRMNKMKKLNLERASLRAKMALLEPSLRTSIGRKNVLDRLSGK